MSYLDIIDKVLKEQERKKKEEPRVVDISLLTLTELSKRNMAIEIYSEILGCYIWLCSNDKMVRDVKRDDPEAVTYTVDEIRHLIQLRPEDIKRIHETKTVFPGSQVVDSQLKETKK